MTCRMCSWDDCQWTNCWMSEHTVSCNLSMSCYSSEISPIYNIHTQTKYSIQQQLTSIFYEKFPRQLSCNPPPPPPPRKYCKYHQITSHADIMLDTNILQGLGTPLVRTRKMLAQKWAFHSQFDTEISWSYVWHYLLKA